MPRIAWKLGRKLAGPGGYGGMGQFGEGAGLCLPETRARGLLVCLRRLRGGGGCVRGRCVRVGEGRVGGSAEGNQEQGGLREGCQRSSQG